MKHLYRKYSKEKNFPLQIICHVFAFAYIFLNELIFSNTFSTGLSFYKILFALSGGMFILFIGNIFKNKHIGFILQSVFCVLISTIYISQHIYYKIFSTPYIISSIGGVSDAMEFNTVAINAFKEQWFVFVFYFALVAIFFSIYRHIFYNSKHFLKAKFVLLPVTIVCVALSVILPLNFSSGIGSAKYLLLNEYIPTSSVKTFGVPVSMALDLRYSLFDSIPYVTVSVPDDDEVEFSPSPTVSDELETSTEPSTEPSVEPSEEPVVYDPQILDIDFNLEEPNSTFLEMNTFFSSRDYNVENEYTGMFEGKNLILITAEAFSDKLIDPVLTPTLYMLATEGFNFENFYTPIWGVSTSDGEFVATTGLIPKSGVWSYTVVADNYMPFAFGNQFNSLGYSSYAFHNHTYTYYNRQLSYPNMGYDYYGKGNGLDIESVWPESDLEMVEEATPMFVDDEQFHVYMLTVSGHLEYNFYGNMMAYRNQDAVADLEYSEAVCAYIACNLELEYALTSLIEQLTEAGQLENTVIALSADHYPYGLEVEEYAELYGKDSIDETFELYENGFILWNSEMESSVTVDKYCSSLDIAATLSNLFNLEYDSRLFIGRDILSDDDGLVMFLDRSYITDDYMYNANTGEITYLTENEVSDEEIEIISQEVSQLFRYSGMIIENDYYGYLFDEE